MPCLASFFFADNLKLTIFMLWKNFCRDSKRSTFKFYQKFRSCINVWWLNYGRCRVGCNATVVIPVPAHLDVSCLPPGSSPGVLHYPVVIAPFCAVADDQHGVVWAVCQTLGLIVHPTCVRLEGGVTGIH